MNTAATATHTFAWLPGAGLNARSRERGEPAHSPVAAYSDVIKKPVISDLSLVTINTTYITQNSKIIPNF